MSLLVDDIGIMNIMLASLKGRAREIRFRFFGGDGMIFGYFPARRAATMEPIDALRHE